MKLISFNCTIEVSKDVDGYSNNYYVDIDEKGVSVSHPYIKQSLEQVQLVNELINQFIDDFNNLNYRVDRFNFDNHLEQYAPTVPPQVETAGSDFDLDAKSAVAQSSRGGSDTTALVAHYEQEQKRLNMEELETRETSSDKT